MFNTVNESVLKLAIKMFFSVPWNFRIFNYFSCSALGTNHKLCKGTMKNKKEYLVSADQTTYTEDPDLSPFLSVFWYSRSLDTIEVSLKKKRY